MWTLFWDMNSGGGRKEKNYDKIYIEAPEAEAKVIFYNRFGHNPDRVSCTCCGADYSIDDYETLEEASAYHRNCRYAYLDENGNEVSKEIAWIPGKGTKRGVVGRYIEEPDREYDKKAKLITMEEYIKKDTVLIIRASEIKDSERVGEVREQGYVWVD